MCCRAWLTNTYCRNHTRGIYCYAHRNNHECPEFVATLPKILLQTIVCFLDTTDRIQMFRATCKHILRAILRGPFSLSKEYKYFRRFWSKKSVTVRQIYMASSRYNRLSEACQKVASTIPRHLKSIEVKTDADNFLLTKNLPRIRELLSQ